MNILILGDNPRISGGVCNYTRPLHQKLNNSNHTCFYLYSSSRVKPEFDFSFFQKIQKDEDFENTYKVVNSKNLEKNFRNLDLDINSPHLEKLFQEFLVQHKIEILHINEMIGFPSSIIPISKKIGIKVIVTIHEDWFLCPKRVMIDFNKKICSGPESNKCSHCINDEIKNTKSPNYIKNIVRLKNIAPNFINFLISFKGKLKKLVKKNSNESIVEDLDFGNQETIPVVNLKDSIDFRIKNNISNLNQSDIVICVSSYVRDKFEHYGVLPEKLITQHIGSVFASSRKEHTKEIDTSKVKLGFVGGVGYYKGVHQLIEALLDLPDEYSHKYELLVYGSYSQSYLNGIYRKFPKALNQNIKFFGRYQYSELPKIFNNFDVSILPSLCADAAPQTIFESYGNGLPIIGPDIGGFTDFIQDKKNGLLFNAADVLDLRKKIKELLDNPNVINEFKKNIPRLKTFDENISELVEIYKEI